MAVVYLDTSALVKLCVHESGTPLAVALWEGADALVTSRIAYAEVNSVISTAERIGRIDAAPGALAFDKWREIKGGLWTVELSQQVSDAAAELVTRRPIRAADGIHLASALLFKELEGDLLFAAWDKRLASAARQEGLQVLPPEVGL